MNSWHVRKMQSRNQERGFCRRLGADGCPARTVELNMAERCLQRQERRLCQCQHGYPPNLQGSMRQDGRSACQEHDYRVGGGSLGRGVPGQEPGPCFLGINCGTGGSGLEE